VGARAHRNPSLPYRGGQVSYMTDVTCSSLTVGLLFAGMLC